MIDYSVSLNAEILYESTFAVLAKYAKYLQESKEPLECIKTLYDSLKNYTDRILLCKSEAEYDILKKNIDEYEKIIDNVSVSLLAGA